MERTSSENVGLLGKGHKLDKQPVLGEYLTGDFGSRVRLVWGSPSREEARKVMLPAFLTFPPASPAGAPPWLTPGKGARLCRPQRSESPAKSKVRGDVEQAQRRRWEMAGPAGKLPQSSFLSAPVQVSTFETVESCPQPTNHSLPQLIFTLLWPLAP